MAYSRDYAGYELGFTLDPKSIETVNTGLDKGLDLFDKLGGAGGKIAGIVNKFRSLFGGSPAEKNCVDMCTGQVIGRFKKKDGGCHELTPLRERAVSDDRYRDKKTTSAGEPWQTAYARLCRKAQGPGVRRPGARRAGGMNPMTLLLLGGGAYLYFSRR